MSKEIELMLANVKASLAVEGLEPSTNVLDITRKYLHGEITEDEALKLINNFIKQQCNI